LHTPNQRERERELSSLCTPQARERKEEHDGFEILGGEAEGGMTWGEVRLKEAWGVREAEVWGRHEGGWGWGRPLCPPILHPHLLFFVLISFTFLSLTLTMVWKEYSVKSLVSINYHF
jgi:hypothetical protein